MNSILKQLAKYAPPPEVTPKIEIKDEGAQENYKRIVAALAELFPVAEHQIKIPRTIQLLWNYQPSPHADVLFPLSLDLAYHCFYKCGKQIVDEERVDQLLFKFLRTVEQTSYLERLLGALEPAAQRIFLARVLQASLTTKAFNKLDCLPNAFAEMAAGKLTCAPTLHAAIEIIDRLSRLVPVDQIILARLAYVAFWYWSKNAEAVAQNINLVRMRCLTNL